MKTFGDDARLAELEFLARVARGGCQKVQPIANDTPERQMIFYLLRHEYLNDMSGRSTSFRSNSTGLELRNDLIERHERDRWYDMNQLLAGQEVFVTIGHKGRVRLAELRQELRSGRDREPFGILWAKRHVLPDISIALTSTSKDAPLSVAFFDANGLKAVNDAHGHQAGDAFIKAFFQSVTAGLGTGGEAFCNGGDEVVAIMPRVTPEAATATCRKILLDLSRKPLVLGESVEVQVTASCGVVSTENPDHVAADLLSAADKAMYAAKAASKAGEMRRNVLVVGDTEPVVVEAAEG